MKFEHNWKLKTLENLEKDVWPPLDPTEGSHLISTCNALRKKQLKDFTPEDLRIMIGQNIGLPFLIPLAIEVLKDDLLAEGNYYPGDLLKNVLSSDNKYWKTEPENWETICQLFEINKKTLDEHDTTWEIRKGWFNAYHNFKEINR